MEDIKYNKFYREVDEHLNGKKVGCPALTYTGNWKKVYADWKDGKITATVAMK